MGKASNNPSKATASSKSKKEAKHSVGGGNGKAKNINAKQQNILETIAKLHRIGKEVVKRDMLAGMSGNMKTKAGFEKNLGILRKAGLLEFGTDKTVYLTDLGREQAGGVGVAPLTNESFWVDVKTMMSPKAGIIFDRLTDGNVHGRRATAEALNYDMKKLSGYDKDLSKMSSLGFLKYNKEKMQLTDDAFPLGRPNGTVFSL